MFKLNLLLQRIIRKLFDNQSKELNHEVICYSQEGEDIILDRIFSLVNDGFYVDVGAHHPFRFSNTYFFYKRGWRGINIDPIPGVKQLFDAKRPLDINLELGINEEHKVLSYYNFKEKALNTFSEPLATQYQNGNWELENIIQIETFKLSEILDQHLHEKRDIHFMSIDVEGFELNVLKSNDWNKYLPNIILLEMLDCKIEDVTETKIGKYLMEKGYTFFAKTLNTVFFKINNE
jgi:FkbM family methyltransferase